jgi:NAD/NADP transhydrogenase alpha subunit
MKIGVAKEIDAAEPRVGATPDTVKKFKALGAEVAVEPGAGLKSGLLDSDYEAAGATISTEAVKDADIVVKVKRPEASEVTRYKKGALVVAIMDPYGNDEDHRAGAVFYQLDEALIGGFVGDVIVAVRCRISHFAMVSHKSLQSHSTIGLQLAQSAWESNGGHPSGRELRTAGGFRRPHRPRHGRIFSNPDCSGKTDLRTGRASCRG